jgi:hypothetical protein
MVGALRVVGRVVVFAGRTPTCILSGGATGKVLMAGTKSRCGLATVGFRTCCLLHPNP